MAAKRFTLRQNLIRSSMKGLHLTRTTNQTECKSVYKKPKQHRFYVFMKISKSRHFQNKMAATRFTLGQKFVRGLRKVFTLGVQQIKQNENLFSRSRDIIGFTILKLKSFLDCRSGHLFHSHRR